jgi:hypothetical protein
VELTGKILKEAEAMRETVASFRMAFWPLFVTILAWGIPIGLGLTGLLLRDLWSLGLPIFATGVVAAVAAGEVAAVVCLVFAIAYFRIHVGTWGVRCFDFWGLYHEVAWDEIVAVRPMNFLFGLSFLRTFRADGRRPLWLPQFLVDGERFTGLVRRFAGPTHPLTRALLEGG